MGYGLDETHRQHFKRYLFRSCLRTNLLIHKPNNPCFSVQNVLMKDLTPSFPERPDPTGARDPTGVPCGFCCLSQSSISRLKLRPEPLSAHHYIDLKNLQPVDSGKALITRNEAARSAQTECACGLQCIGSFQMRGSAYVCSVRDDCGA